MKYTPGPWEVAEPHVDSGAMQIGSSKDYVCMIYSNPNDEVGAEQNKIEELANANLIAAAPDLLEACKSVVQWHREHDSGEGELFGLDFVTTCIAAIRIAEPDWKLEK